MAEDIEYLRETWSDGASDSDLRRGSALLRRFLVDGGNGTLVVVWHEVGFEGQPMIVAPLSREALASREKINPLRAVSSSNTSRTISAVFT